MGKIEFSVGHFSMLIYILLTAMSPIFIHQANQQVEPIIAAFYTFLFCLLIYNLFNIKTSIRIKTILEDFWVVVMLNITTMLCWVLSFISLKYIPPDLYLFIYLCAMPITGAILYKRKILQALSLLAGLIFFARTFHVTHLALGFLLAFVGGSCGTIYSIVSKKIAHRFSVTAVLALRFYLTVLVTGLAGFYLGYLHWMNLSYYTQFGLLSLFAVVIPLLLFQVGLKTLPLSKTLAFLPFAPLCCYVINHFILQHAEINFLQLCSVAVLSLAMIF